MESIIGVKIQARNEMFINPTIPTRDEIRIANYRRRQKQLSSEGFKSKPWKPYIMLGGEPVEFIVKRNATDTVLANETEGADRAVTTTFSRSEFGGVASSAAGKYPQNHRNLSRGSNQSADIRKFIRKEVSQTDQVNQRVKGGQSFFNIIQKEEEEKKSRAEEVRVKAIQEVKPAFSESDSESNDERPQSGFSTKLSSRPETSVSGQSRSRRSKMRPFTPMFNNISRLPSRATNYSSSSRHTNIDTGQTTETPLNISEDCAYRQLCALHWLFDCMVHDTADSAPRICLSWGYRNPEEDQLTSNKSNREIKLAWDKYVSKSKIGEKLREPQGSAKVHQSPQLTAKYNSETSSVITDGDEMDKRLQPKKSSTISGSSPEKGFTNQQVPDKTWSHNSVVRQRRVINKLKAIEAELLEDDDLEYRRSLHLMRIGRAQTTVNRIPQATALRAEDRCSERAQQFVEESRLRSRQMAQEREAELRDNIKNMRDYKMTICRSKFDDISTKGSFQQMLKGFQGNKTYSKFFSNLDASRNKGVYADWFIGLRDALLQSSKSPKIEAVLSKIRQFAPITTTRLTCPRLYTVLSALTQSELRNPDVAAAVSFISEHVLQQEDGGVEELLKWQLSTAAVPAQGRD